jgi:hypothetical protein
VLQKILKQYFDEVFDVYNTCVDFIQLLVYDDEALIGHLMLVFIAATIDLLTKTLLKPFNTRRLKHLVSYAMYLG